MHFALSLPALLTLLLVLPGSGFAQVATATETVPSVVIQVEGKPPLSLTEEDLSKMPSKTTKVKEHETETTYSGVSLHDLLVKAGAPTGSQLHGRALSSYVLATAKDGYEAVFTLTEMDPGFTEDDVLLVDRANGTPLTATQGPFRLIVPHDKKPARSVRMLQKVEVVQLRQ